MKIVLRKQGRMQKPHSWNKAEVTWGHNLGMVPL
jgi:hypothetical protein